jgi:hypothetical protein
VLQLRGKDGTAGPRILVSGACVPTRHHFCVSFSASARAFAVQSEPGGAFVPRAALTLKAGHAYAFEAMGEGFTGAPFALTPQGSSAVLSEGVEGTNPLLADSQQLSFTPASRGPSALAYGSPGLEGAGGQIRVTGACVPAERYFCVHLVDGR